MNIDKKPPILPSPNKGQKPLDSSPSQETQARVLNSPEIATPTQTVISEREVEAVEFIHQIPDQKLTEAYEQNQSITIGSVLAFERFKHLIKNGTISLGTIQSITIGDKDIVSEHYKKLVDNLLTFLSENQTEFKNPFTLTILKPYQGQLIIPTLQQLDTLLMGEVFGALIIKSQPNLKDITVEKVHNILTIERQNELEKLSIHCLDGHAIEIQPKLKSLKINVCHSDLSLQDQPSLETIEFERVWGIVSMNEQQRASLNKDVDCRGNGMIFTAKSQAELAGPIPMDRLLTFSHFQYVIGINKRIYIFAALFEIARSTNLVNYAVQFIAEYRHLLSNVAIEQAYTSIYQLFTQIGVASFFSEILANPTGLYIGLAIIGIGECAQEIQRIYSNERKMMFFS